MNGVIASAQVVTNLERRIRATVIANELIPIYRVVTATGYLADSTNVFHKWIVQGISLAEIANGTSGYVISEGLIENSSWTWTTGNILYLNGTSISTTPPTTGFRVIIGRAIAPTKIYVCISESILL